MATPTSIELLLALTVRECEEAIKQLGNAVRSSNESQEKNDLLVSRRGEYVVQLQMLLSDGINMQQHINHRAFIKDLDRAIARQTQICLTELAKVVTETQVWQQCEYNRLKYKTLSNRATALLKKAELRQEQRDTDEFASRNRIIRTKY